MDSNDSSNKKTAILVATWDYLMKTGLGKASVGELCKLTKISQSSLYYWFDNKDDIWVSAGKYGLSKVVGALLDFTFNHIDDVPKYFATLLDEAEKYKYELRLALQITTSPIYGDGMRAQAFDFRVWYERYAEKLMNVFGCTEMQAEIFIYSIISFIVDYVIWDDREKTQMLLDNLHYRIKNVLDME